jgi:glucose/arabinose dehydrogenase
VRVAPNGDVFVAESDAGRIRIMQAADGAEQPQRTGIFVRGLDRPFGIAFYPPGPDPQWLYVATNNSVERFPYRNGDQTARGKPWSREFPNTLAIIGRATWRSVGMGS